MSQNLSTLPGSPSSSPGLHEGKGLWNKNPYTGAALSGRLEGSIEIWGQRGRISQEDTIVKHMTGTIKTLTDRGFGFISREGETKDLFFHSKDLNGVTFEELKQGDTVSFEIQNGEKGPSAVNVTRA